MLFPHNGHLSQSYALTRYGYGPTSSPQIITSPSTCRYLKHCSNTALQGSSVHKITTSSILFHNLRNLGNGANLKLLKILLGKTFYERYLGPFLTEHCSNAAQRTYPAGKSSLRGSQWRSHPARGWRGRDLTTEGQPAVHGIWSFYDLVSGLWCPGQWWSDEIFSRFASVTVNLGPTFLSGALAANAGAVMDEPSCPLVQVTRQHPSSTVIISISGPLQALCPQCYLDSHQSALHHVDYLPPEETLQGLHKDQYRGSQGSQIVLHRC